MRGETIFLTIFLYLPICHKETREYKIMSYDCYYFPLTARSIFHIFPTNQPPAKLHEYNIYHCLHHVDVSTFRGSYGYFQWCGFMTLYSGSFTLFLYREPLDRSKTRLIFFGPLEMVDVRYIEAFDNIDLCVMLSNTSLR